MSLRTARRACRMAASESVRIGTGASSAARRTLRRQDRIDVQGLASGQTRSSKSRRTSDCRTPPNILLVLIDDAGYGQMGTFGGGIPTPTLDRVANNGIRYTRFHTTALCSPTRAALLTGRNHHSVGTRRDRRGRHRFPRLFGHHPAHGGDVRRNLARIRLCQRLVWQEPQRAGLGDQSRRPLRSLGRWSGLRLFLWLRRRRYRSIPSGAGGKQEAHRAADDQRRWLALSLDDRHGRPRHPHDPRQPRLWRRSGRSSSISPRAPRTRRTRCPSRGSNKFKGQFDMGWDKYREQTIARQKKLGVVPQSTKLTPRPESLPAWDSLPANERKVYARMMEVFAGFTAHTDHEVGRVIDAIDADGRTGQHDRYLHGGRQRLERRRGLERPAQRDDVLQRHPRALGDETGRPRHAGQRQSTTTTFRPPGPGPWTRPFNGPSKSPATLAARATDWPFPGPSASRPAAKSAINSIT